MEKVKLFIRPVVQWLWKMSWLRKIVTSNYSSGNIALGEKNAYIRFGNWINVDIDGADFNIDFRSHETFPFESNSQKVIYSSHAMEHIPEKSLEYILRESYRILKVGGFIRIEVPDAEKIITSYKNNDRKFIDYFVEGQRPLLERGFPENYIDDHNVIIGLLSCYKDSVGHVPVIAEKDQVDSKLNMLSMEDFADWCVSLQTEEQLNSGGHVNPIFFEKISRLLKEAGFKDIMKMNNRETRIPIINIKNIERSQRSFYSLYVEAVK